MNTFRRLVVVALVVALPACKKKPEQAIEKPVHAVEKTVHAFDHFADDDQALAIVSRYLPNSPVILEAGSYHGETALAMVQRWPAATIYSFEPVPELFAIVKRNTLAFPNIHPSDLALSDREGTAVFHLSAMEGRPDASLGSGSLLAPSHHLEGFPWVKFDNTITVSTTTIDAWAGTHQVEKIDFIWLDIQGEEFPVLKAAPRMMKTVKVVMTEVEFVELYKGQSLYAEIRQWFEARGFDEVATDFAAAAPRMADLKNRKGTSWYGNSIFVRK
jgi:FkbM family methyltransferase